jgi:hypothetical protein
MKRRRRGIQYPYLGGCFIDDLWPQMGSTSPLLVQICRKTTSKTCKCCKTTIKLGKKKKVFPRKTTSKTF